MKLRGYNLIYDGDDRPRNFRDLYYCLQGDLDILDDDIEYLSEKCVDLIELACSLYIWINCQQFQLSTYEFYPEGCSDDYPEFSFVLYAGVYRLKSHWSGFESVNQFTVHQLADSISDYLKSIQLAIYNMFSIDIMVEITNTPHTFKGGYPDLVKTDVLMDVILPLTSESRD